MSSYRFCRTDDIGLLVDALNRCWSPHHPGDPPVTAASFKRSIRDLQVWCSSCMVAFSGADPIGVLIGAKRRSGTLIHKIAVHPDHARQGHGRHLLTSLSSKLSILGPPRIVAEVPEALATARRLFSECGYVEEALLTDYVLERRPREPGSPVPVEGPALSEPSNAVRVEGPALSEPRNTVRVEGPALSEPRNTVRVEGFVIPVTVDDLAANGLLEAGEGGPPLCWQRSAETLTGRKDEISGFAVASDERIEAYLLCVGPDSPTTGLSDVQILSLRSFVDDDGARLKQLLGRLGTGTFQFPKVHQEEISPQLLEWLGFRPTRSHLLLAAKARSA